MRTNSELTLYIEEFLQKTGMSATTFGVKANNDPNTVFDLKKGRGFGEKIQTRICEFIENYAGE